MQCACAELSSVACLAVPYFPHDLINGTIFREKVIEHKMGVLIFSTEFFVKHFLLYEEFGQIVL
jgi:hypothetical protein